MHEGRMDEDRVEERVRRLAAERDDGLHTEEVEVTDKPRTRGDEQNEVVVLQRRHIFSAPRHLLAAVLDLSLATVVISRFARCRAAADGRVKVSLEDVREGISVAELTLLSHAALSEQGKLMKNLRWLLLTKRESFRALLATEA